MESNFSSRTTVAVFLMLVIVLAVSGALLLHEMRRQNSISITIHPPLPTDTPAPTPTHEPILVYVTGAVANPEQLYTLPWGSRVEDVLAAAGGLTDAANRSAVNLAAIVRDGDQIHVAATTGSAADFELATPSGGRRVRINSASQEELETLPGVGPVTAQRIIEYREQVGEFTDLDDLDQVSGIGPRTLENLQDQLAFD